MDESDTQGMESRTVKGQDLGEELRTTNEKDRVIEKCDSEVGLGKVS
jgi:hypothetical protein